MAKKRSHYCMEMGGSNKHSHDDDDDATECRMPSKHKRVSSQEKHVSKKTIPGTDSSPNIVPIDRQLPDPKQNVDPDVFLCQLIEAKHGYCPKTKLALSLGDFFPDITEEQIASYDMSMVAACRENDVDTVKSLHIDNGQSVECCNRFGESLLHMACRRGFTKMVDFLLQDAKLSVRIRDDCGRTPLHDACWNPQPQLDIMKWLVERDATLLLVQDKRGSTPFQYARPQDWPTWRQFLWDHQDCLDTLVDSKDVFS